MILALYHCILSQKSPPIFREFSGNFPEISGENFRAFSAFRKFPRNFPWATIFYNAKNIDFRSVTCYLRWKNTRSSRGTFTVFGDFGNFPKSFQEKHFVKFLCKIWFTVNTCMYRITTHQHNIHNVYTFYVQTYFFVLTFPLSYVT